MSALLSPDEIATILSAHLTIITRLSPLDDTLSWRCSCGSHGLAVDLDAFALGARLHVASVLAAAIELARRGASDPIGADELAEQYYDRAGRILNITGFDGCAAWMGVEPFWHIDTDLIVTMLNAGRMTVVETGVYELRGLPVRGHEADGDLDDDAPVFALVIQ